MKLKQVYHILLVRYRQNQVNVLHERIENGEMITNAFGKIDNVKELIKHEKLLGTALDKLSNDERGLH